MPARMSDLQHMLRQMKEIRTFENQLQTLFSQGLIRGSTHLANGQEAVAVGAAAALAPNDLVFCTYRGHHHCLARGMSPESAFAEILGRADGCCGGMGGSMHLTDVSLGLLGSYAIVGAHIPIAVGCAWASRMSGDGAVTCCFFGDGTTTIGSFHEALNLAALWHLPIVFVCENNQYSEYTPIHEVVPIEYPAADRAAAYGLTRILVEGNDVEAVQQAVAEARRTAADGKGPVLIEAATYRKSGHSRADPGAYKPAAEVEYWTARDPITLLEAKLSLSADDLQAMDRGVEERIAAAMETALGSPEPAPEKLLSGVWGTDS
jgi:TPP-dependent pyruvate/acetoin dehydrogenase alpha subunit